MGGWTHVTDDHPCDPEPVLVCAVDPDGDPWITIGCWNADGVDVDGEWLNEHLDCRLRNVTHWMPLPEMP